MPLVALFFAFVASFTWRHAPLRGGWWKAAIAVGEYSHWFVWLPLGLAALAWQLLAGWVCVLTLGLCLAAVASLLRPLVLAKRLARSLPAGLAGAFGAAAVARRKPFSLRRLFWHPGPAPADVRTETFATHDGVELQLDFYGAKGSGDGGAAPCLVVIHGGGWDGGDRSQLAAWNHRWAARGYAVASISYRLAPRFRWPAPREDVAAALAWLKAQAGRLGLDPRRLVLVGRSAGGQIATAVGYGARDPAIVGVVSLYAPQDMQWAWSVSREDDALNSVNLMRQYLGGPPDTAERRALYDSASAQLLAGPGAPPTLLLHGRPDTLVWYRHSERFARRLREVGTPHFHLELPWATHGFDFNLDGPSGQLADHAIDGFLHAVTRSGGGAGGAGRV